MKKWYIAIGVLIAMAVALVVMWKPIVFQTSLIRSSIAHPETLACARLFCQRIVANDTPTAEWLSSVDDGGDSRVNKTNYFYFLKVHFTECRTSMMDLGLARILVFNDSPTKTLANFYYQRNAPCLQMTIKKTTRNDWKVHAVFPLNNCTFNPDLNNDGMVDQKDVELARNPTTLASNPRVQATRLPRR